MVILSTTTSSITEAIEKEAERGPKFVIEPPAHVVFSNSSGTVINCNAIGSPTPRVWWMHRDNLRSGHESGDLASLSISFPGDPSLHLHPHHSSFSVSSSSSSSSPLLGSSNSLRHIRSDGSLLFSPFGPESFRPDVHSSAYLCVASNSQGSIVSRDVNVKAGECLSFPSLIYETYFLSLPRLLVSLMWVYIIVS